MKLWCWIKTPVIEMERGVERRRDGEDKLEVVKKVEDFEVKCANKGEENSSCVP